MSKQFGWMEQGLLDTRQLFIVSGGLFTLENRTLGPPEPFDVKDREFTTSRRFLMMEMVLYGWN